MIGRVAILSLAIGFGGCADVPMDVATLSDQRAKIAGHRVDVEGRIAAPCDIMGCAFYSLDGERRVSLALGTAAENSLRAAAGRTVVLRVEATDNCTRPEEICTDRASEVIPIRLVRYLD